MATNSFSFLSRSEYFTDLKRAIDDTQPGDRVAVASMTFEPHWPLIHQLLQSLGKAADRGVHTSLSVDAYSFLARDGRLTPGPLWYRNTLATQLAEPFRSQQTALQALEVHGVQVGITNWPKRPFSVIPAGRSHIKAAVVNDMFYVGGCNLQAPAHTDIMARRSHQATADWLYGQLNQLAVSASTAETFGGIDQRQAIDAQTELLIDGGIPKQSTIYEQALRLIDEARERITLTCQYFPGGRTAERLKAAQRRGVAVQLVYSHPSAHGQKSLIHHLHIGRERLRLPASLFTGRRPKQAPLLHAKVLVTDRGSLLGSHNYVSYGVDFGTAEIALFSRDADFGQQLLRKLATLLPESSAFV